MNQGRRLALGCLDSSFILHPSSFSLGAAPLRLEVERVARVLAQLADGPAVGGDGLGGEPGAGRLVQQRGLHELVGEAGHGAADADAADVGAAADAADPAALADVAVDHRPPAAELDQALGPAVLAGEFGLLVV